MNNDMEQVNLINWHDYSFEKLELKFDDIKVYICDEFDNIIEITCEKHIGILYLGHWDETVIKSMSVCKGSKITSNCIGIIKSNYKDMLQGGGYRKIENLWHELVIEFIDSNKLTIVCNSISIYKH